MDRTTAELTPLLVACSSPADLQQLADVLTSPGYAVTFAATVDEVERAVAARPFAAVLVTPELLDAVRPAALRQVPVLVLTPDPAGAAAALARPDALLDFAALPPQKELLQARIGTYALLHRARAAAERTEDRYDLLMENIQDYLIFGVDPQGLITSWNIGAERVTGFREDEVLGRYYGFLFTPEDRAEGVDREELRTAVAQGRADDIRWHLRKDGTRFFVTGVNTALRDAAGELRGFSKVGRDTTARKTAELALKAGAETQRLALAAARLVVWSWDSHSDRVDYQGDVEGVLGGPSVARLAAFLARVHADDRAQVRHAFRRLVAYGEPYQLEFRVVHRDGSIRWLASQGGAHRDGILQLAGIAMDVTARKLAAEAVREKALLLDLTSDAVLVHDPGSRILSWNKGAERLYGYTADEAFGRHVDELLQTRFPVAREAILRTLAVTGRWEGELTHVCRDGHALTVASRWALHQVESDGSRRILQTNTDITERARSQQELLKARDLAEAANRAKSQFLANMSHEIRTPLGAILGFAELLRDPHLTPVERQSFIETVHRNGYELTSLIDDILDLSKVEANHLEVERLRVSLPNLLTDVTTSLSLKAGKKGLKLLVESDGRVPELIVTDPTRLRQILLNVIGNAVKFTSEGSVSVVVRLQDDGMIAFAVTDTGAGIDAVGRSRLFRAFSQADASTTRRFGGTGLGLILSRKLARLLGGDVVLTRSEPNVGSSFVVTVDAGLADGDAPAAPMAPVSVRRPTGVATTRSLRVLVADDAPDNRLLIRRFLKRDGVEVDSAENGAQAVEKAMEGPYDLVLMDIQMPVLDGYDATAELRRRGFQKPIIALTAHAMKEEREKALEAGCDDHLTKPVDRRRLLAAVAFYTETQPPPD